MLTELNVIVRWALYLDLMLLFGLPAFHLYTPGAARPSVERAVALKPWLMSLTVFGIVLSAIGLAVLCAAMADMPLMRLDRSTVMLVLNETPAGAAWKIRTTLLVLTSILLLGQSQARLKPTVLTLLGLVELATLAWTGHGAAGEGTTGKFALAANVAHLTAAGIWIGGLAAFCMLLFHPAAQQERAHVASTAQMLGRFSVVGSAVVAVLVATGLVNSLMLVGLAGVPRLLSSLYGQLLAAKLALFAVMLVLAAANRFFLTPALSRLTADRSVATIAALRRSLFAETAVALTILALVALMGTLAPPAVVQ